MPEAPEAWRCPECGMAGRITPANELCLFLQEPLPVLIGSGLLVPRAHRPTLFDLDADEWAATHSLLRQARAARPASPAAGLQRRRTAGQEIFHAHLHVIPRFEDEPLAGKGIRYWLKQPGNARPG